MNISELAPLGAYAQARAAGALGAAERAAKGYDEALTADPGNKVLAQRALAQGVAAGDFDLALKAAHILQKAGQSSMDVKLLLLAEATRKRDWKRADAQVDLIGRDEVFSFMAPILRAWIAQGTGRGNPVDDMTRTGLDPLAISYVADNRPLLMLAAGRDKDALEAISKLQAAGDAREWRLRLAAAAALQRKGKSKDALALLTGDAEQFVTARRLVDAGRPLGTEVMTPAEGLSEFLLEVALDLRRQDVVPLALSFSRMATYLSPDNSEARVFTAELLSSLGQSETALTVLKNIPADDVFASAARDSEVKLLSDSGQDAAALKEAQAAAAARGAGAADLVRLGNVYSDQGKQEDAAEAFARALAAGKKDGLSQPEWTLWLLRGGALEQADKWPAAKDALEAAYKLAPKEPLVLNYLGYAQLERRENIAAAEGLIREASRLAPDSPQITDSLGWARYLRGDLKEAIPLLEKAAQAEPADAAINEHLGDAYFSAGRRYEARYAWRAALVSADGADADRLKAKIESGLTPELASR